MWQKNDKIHSNFFFSNKKFKEDKRSFLLNHGDLALFAEESGFVTAAEVKSVAFFFRKNVKKNGKIWFNILPNVTFTKKSIGTRMGKGKGLFSTYAFPVKKGRLILEVKTENRGLSYNLLKQIQFKLNLKSKIVKFKV